MLWFYKTGRILIKTQGLQECILFDKSDAKVKMWLLFYNVLKIFLNYMKMPFCSRGIKRDNLTCNYLIMNNHLFLIKLIHRLMKISRWWLTSAVFFNDISTNCLNRPLLVITFCHFDPCWRRCVTDFGYKENMWELFTSLRLGTVI